MVVQVVVILVMMVFNRSIDPIVFGCLFEGSVFVCVVDDDDSK